VFRVTSHAFIKPYAKLILNIKFLRKVILVELRVNEVSQCRRSHQWIGHVRFEKCSSKLLGRVVCCKPTQKGWACEAESTKRPVSYPQLGVALYSADIVLPHSYLSMLYLCVVHRNHYAKNSSLILGLVISLFLM
jgi:hypothetical protein